MTQQTRRMNIALDIDNVVCGILDSARQVIASLADVPLHEIQDTNVYWQPFTHSDPHVAARLQPDHAFWDREDVLLGAQPLPEAVNAAWVLYDAGLFGGFVTRRNPTVASITKQWFFRHDFPVVPVHHVGHTNPEANYAQCKSTACLAHGITHIIDDHVDEVDGLLEAGVEVILVDAPIGRPHRREYLRYKPHLRVAPDVMSAVQMLLVDMTKAA